MREVYLDNAATTKLDEKVLEEMLPFLREKYGNPSSLHSKGQEAKNAIEESREKVSVILNSKPEEIIFTGSGTESDNLAVLGYARKNQEKGRHLITTTIEHHAVLDAFKKLEKEGFEVTYLNVNSEGKINMEELKDSIREDTILASIIYANNEIGVIQEIKEISRICGENNVTFHTDACQAANYLETDVEELGVDLMSLNSSKIYGPKGAGILYKSKGKELEPIVHGGGQEFNFRSGTENVANIIGMAKALEKASKHRQEESERLKKLRDYFINELLKMENTKLNGAKEDRLPNNINVSFLNIEGESVILMLSEEGIYASTGSACSSNSLESSHVIKALGLPAELGHSSIRFSLGKDTTKEDLNYTLEKLRPVIKKLRQMSPLNKNLSEVLENE